MADTQTWTEHFGISEQHLQQWKAGDGSTPFLSWCLQTGVINETRYMQWAASHYRLPIVKDSFFALPAVDQNWTTGKFLYQWTADLLPLEDWDGVVRVACYEPPINFQLSQSHVFVLASPRQLQILWHRFFPQAPVATITPMGAQPAVAEAFDPSSILAAYNEHADAAEAVELGEPQLDENGEPTAHAAEAEELGMPDGFVMATADIDIPMPSFGGIKIVVTPTVAESKPVALAPDLVEHTAADFGSPVLLNDEVTPAPEGFAPPSPLAEAASVPAPPAAPAPEIVVAAVANFVAAALPKAPGDFDLCDSVEEVVSCAFAKMSAHFQYQMALLPTSDSLTPWLWAGKFVREAPSERPDVIDLITPSVFRIVMRTSMPYHGQTRPSDVNDKFFKEWTQGAAPPLITLVPVVIDEHTALLLFGAMDNVIEPRAALSDMEHWARSAALACRRISEKASTHAA